MREAKKKVDGNRYTQILLTSWLITKEMKTKKTDWILLPEYIAWPKAKPRIESLFQSLHIEGFKFTYMLEKKVP